jgi:serine/threonine protein kinase
VNANTIDDARTAVGGVGNGDAGTEFDRTIYFNFAAGAHVGPHTLLRQIGVGGMGEVYEARCEGRAGLCAVKVLARNLADDPHAVRAFRREAELMRALRHPGVVAVEDAGADGSCHWLRMELMRSVWYRDCEVKSLDDYIKAHDSGLDQGTCYAIIENVARAVAAAHEARLVHRDIKPANILMTHCDDLPGDTAVMDVRVADFGMVAVVGESWVRRQTQLSLSCVPSMGECETRSVQDDRRRALVGTYSFMSPEQKRGLPTDARTDVYSLGLVAFRALVGGDPSPVPPSRRRADLLPAWDAVLLKAMDPEPENRFADGSEFRDGMTALGAELVRCGLLDRDKG